MKSLKYLTEGLFDADDSLETVGLQAEWENCFKDETNKYSKAQYLNGFDVDLQGDVLTVTRRKNSGAGTIYFNLKYIEGFCEEHKIKKVVWNGEYVCFIVADIDWEYPITFVVGHGFSIYNGYNVRDSSVQNIKFEGEEMEIPSKNKFGLGCELDINVFTMREWDIRKTMGFLKVTAEAVNIDFEYFPLQIDKALGRVRSEKDAENDWSRYIEDVKMPHRKGTFCPLYFEDMDTKKAAETIKNAIFANPKNVNINNILIHFRNLQWYTVRVTKNNVEVCKGYYAASCRHNKTVYEVRV